MIINDKTIGNSDIYSEIDKKAHPDNEAVTFHGLKTTAGEVRRMYDFAMERPKSMLVVYDDIFQYTSLGLLDLLYDLHKIEAPIPIKEFLERDCSGEEFVLRFCELWNIPKEEVELVEKEFYNEILRRSPLSKNALPILKLRESMDSGMFVLKYDSPGVRETIQEMCLSYMGSKQKSISFELIFTGGHHLRDLLRTLKSFTSKYFEFVITPDAQSIREYVNNANFNFFTEILTTVIHNGIPDKDLLSILQSKDHGEENEKCTFSFIEEGLS